MDRGRGGPAKVDVLFTLANPIIHIMPEWRSCSAELVHSGFESDYLDEEEEEGTATQPLSLRKSCLFSGSDY